MKKSPAYKDSGIEWIGDIPEDWGVIKVKHLMTEKGTLFIDGSWIESNNIEESGIRYLTTGNVGPGYYKEQGTGYISEETFSKLNCIEVIPGDIIISRLNEPIGRSCIVPNTHNKYVVAVDIVILRPDSIWDKRFIVYAMNHPLYNEYAKLISAGATMQRISRTNLGNLVLPFTIKEKQVQICDYLDKKTFALDETIDAKNRLIDLLKEKRQAIITQAVTVGLDSTVTMKDSGVNWIGKIPEDWKILRIKNVVEGIKDGTHGSFHRVPIGRPLLSAKNVFEEGLYLSENESLITEEDFRSIISNGYPKKNDVLLCSVGTIGRSCIYTYDEPFAFQRSVMFLRPNYIIVPQYLHFFLISSVFQNELKSKINMAAQGGVYMGTVSNMMVILPSKEQQLQIVKYLEQELSGIDSVIVDLTSQIMKLIEYRQSIISEAVTGKVVV